MNNANAQILAVAVTPDGQYAAAGASSTQALVYNVSRANMLNLKRVYRLVGHAAPVRREEVCSCSAVIKSLCTMLQVVHALCHTLA
jgi:hypothetical protein